MQTVCEYQIIPGEYLSDMVAAVHEAITEGWQPIGGPFTYHHPDGFDLLCQAMVKMEETILGYPVKRADDFGSVVLGELEDIGSEFYPQSE